MTRFSLAIIKLVLLKCYKHAEEMMVQYVKDRSIQPIVVEMERLISSVSQEIVPVPICLPWHVVIVATKVKKKYIAFSVVARKGSNLST